MPHGLKTAKLSTSACPRLKWFLPETTSAEGTNDNIFNMREKEEKSEQIMRWSVAVCVIFMAWLNFCMNVVLINFLEATQKDTHTAMFTEGSPLSSRRERQGRTDISLHYCTTCSDTYTPTYCRNDTYLYRVMELII